MTLLACSNCNAPLPPPQGTFVTCAYCKATSMIAHGVATRVQGVPAPPQQPVANPREKALAAWKAVMEQRGGPERAAMHAATELLLVRQDGVSAEEMAVGAVAIARAFDAERKTNVLSDANGMIRIMEGFRLAIVELRSVQTTTLNLPFLCANENGPMHLERVLDAATVAALVHPR